MSKLVLDHIVLFVPDLEEAISFFENALNVTPIFGGKHIGYGTHNALLGLGSPENLSYLELFALDPEDTAHYVSYPMGISKEIKEMCVGGWCIRCSMDTDIVEANQSMKLLGKEYDHGLVRKMQRITPSNSVISWQIASTSEQVVSSKGQIPFLIKWDNLDLHPTTRLAETNFVSYNLSFLGPKCNQIQKNLYSLGLEKNELIEFEDRDNASIKLSLYGKKNALHFNSCKT